MAKSQPISLIVTILNEADTIQVLLDAIKLQTRQPDEVVIVDGGSTDRTLQLIKLWQKNHKQFLIKIFVKKGNRAVGRNCAIEKATYDWIAITDAGCKPNRKWLEELEKKQIATKAEVIAGYYNAQSKNSLSEAIVPYILVMPDRIDPNRFLPATRSMMMHRTVWEDVGKFNESLASSEDYVFAKKIEKSKFKIAFAQKAIVTWFPMTTFRHFMKIIYEFAYWDMVGGIVRPKVVLVVVRYMALLLISGYLLSVSLTVLTSFLIIVFLLYALWSIAKNYRYAKQAWWWLPVLQVTSDFAVMVGTTMGWLVGK